MDNIYVESFYIVLYFKSKKLFTWDNLKRVLNFYLKVFEDWENDLIQTFDAGTIDTFWWYFFIQVLHILTKKITVNRHYTFSCAWESTSKYLPKSQLNVGI